MNCTLKKPLMPKARHRRSVSCDRRIFCTRTTADAPPAECDLAPARKARKRHAIPGDHRLRPHWPIDEALDEERRRTSTPRSSCVGLSSTSAASRSYRVAAGCVRPGSQIRNGASARPGSRSHRRARCFIHRFRERIGRHGNAERSRGRRQDRLVDSFHSDRDYRSDSRTRRVIRAPESPAEVSRRVAHELSAREPLSRHFVSRHDECRLDLGDHCDQ